MNDNKFRKSLEISPKKDDSNINRIGKNARIALNIILNKKEESRKSR